jgi:hypothetical protein
MTFQNLIIRIPKWNSNIIEKERKRIIDKSGCTYLEELVTCIHIIQLKLLTAIRVGNKQKKIDINIPKLDDFIHKVYVISARKIYKSVFLFENSVSSLQMQKNNRELEIIIQECILNAVRESIPVDKILQAYMDETEETVVEEVKEQIIEEKPDTTNKPVSEFINDNFDNNNNNNNIVSEGITKKQMDLAQEQEVEENAKSLKFNDIDTAVTEGGTQELIEAPKTIERLEEISNLRNQQRKLEEENDNDDTDKLNISSEEIVLNFDSLDLPKEEEIILQDIELL